MGGRITRWAATLAAMAGVLAMGACADGPDGGGGGERDGRQGAELAAEDARRAGDAQRPRRRGQPAADQGARSRSTATSNPKAAQRVTFTTATAPELSGKVKAQQKAGRLDIDLVLTGTDGLAAGIEQDLWLKGLPELGDGLDAPYLEPAAKMQEQAEDAGVLVNYYPSGPLLEYAPDRVSEPPTTPQALLAWAKENPGKFMYARPSNSGPGADVPDGPALPPRRQGPAGPDQRLGQDVGLPEGARQVRRVLPVGHQGHDVGPGRRVARHDPHHDRLGHQPARARHRAEGASRSAAFDDLHWVTDAHYMVVPKGISDGQARGRPGPHEVPARRPSSRRSSYDDGYFYPGPAIKGVRLDMAPAEEPEGRSRSSAGPSTSS